MKKIFKDKKAITLIALVITIVILIILAGVLVSLTLGDNGLFTRTRLAKQQYEYAEAKEIVDLKLVDIHAECMTEGKEYNAKEINYAITNNDKLNVIKTFSEDEEGKPTTDITDVVLSTNTNSTYKFLVGNKGKIDGVTMEEVTNETEKSDFTQINIFETETLGIVATNNSKPKEYIFEPSKIDEKITINNVSIDENGIATFEQSNSHILVNDNFLPGNNTWKIVTKFKVTNASVGHSQAIIGKSGAYNPCYIGLQTNNKLRTHISTNNSKWDVAIDEGQNIISENTWYWLVFEYTGTEYKVSISTDNQNYTVDKIVETSSKQFEQDKVVFGDNLFYPEQFNGQIDLKETYIKIGNNYFFNGLNYCTEK